MEKALLEEALFDVKKEALEKGFRLSFKTIGRSMFPLLVTGDCITIVKCGMDNYRQGDIILYRTKGTGAKRHLVAHRFIGKTKTGDKYVFIAKGDTSFRRDLPIDSCNVIGKVSGVRKKGVNIPLSGPFARVINLYMYFLSITRIMPVAYLFLRKLKQLFNIACVQITRHCEEP